jgi:hypothetical protein
MLPYVDLVLFAIHAAIKLGQKIQTVFEDEIRDRELVLPPVGFADSELPTASDTEDFFTGEGKVFVAKKMEVPSLTGNLIKLSETASLFDLWNQWQKGENPGIAMKKLREAAKILMESGKADDVRGEYRRDSQKFYAGVNALFVVKQWRLDPKPSPLQRLAGTIVELALDYVKADPTLFGGKAIGDRVVRSFLLSLDDVQFAEKKFDDLLLDILQASLSIFRTQGDLIIADDTLALLLKRMSVTLADNIKKAEDSNDPLKLLILNTFRRETLQDFIRISAATVSENTTRLLGPPDSPEDQLLNGVLQAVLDVIQGEQGNLFSSQTLKGIYQASLSAAAQNVILLLPDALGKPRQVFLAALINGMAGRLATAASEDPFGLFTPDLLQGISALALDTLADHAAALINPQKPQEQLLVEALDRIILALSAKFHQDEQLPGVIASVFSQRQLMALVGEAFGAVAQNPQALVAGLQGDGRRAALAQIIGSVAAVVNRDLHHLLSGDGYVQLLTVALQAFSFNPDQLLDLNSADPLNNVMSQVLIAVVDTAAHNLEAKGRNLIMGDTLIEIMDAALATVSKNTRGFRSDSEIVSLVLSRLLAAANKDLINELDAENLLQVFPVLLYQVLQQGRGLLELSDRDLILPLLDSQTV